MKPIRVLFDNQIFQLQSHGGISRYFTELIREFNSNPSLGIEPVLSQDKVHNKHLLNESGIVGLKPIHSRLRAFLNLLSFQLLVRRRPTDVDIVHSTFYLPGFFPKKTGALAAVTVYDMIPELYPDRRRLWNPHFQKKSYLRKADLVVAISESAANDMKNVLGIDRESTITYLGVGTEFQSGLEPPSWITAPYFVFVGNRSGYKDADVAFEAFALVAKSNPELRLLLVGGGLLSTGELNALRSLGISSRVEQRNVSNSDLPNAYSNALGLLYPTRYEGFGLPLLEAMASEIPVLCSNTDINREIAGEAGNFFEVGNSKALADLMASVFITPEGFKDRLSLGKSRSKEFTWRRCAEITANSYRKLLESQRRQI
jgi:glycosyltransferase involved in cell wall biosynthesis